MSAKFAVIGIHATAFIWENLNEAIKPLWQNEPKAEDLSRFIRPFIGLQEPLERVRVLFENQACDMFVSEIGHMRTSWREPLGRNELATTIYRTASLRRQPPSADPERLPWIAGPAVLFDRQVWF